MAIYDIDWLESKFVEFGCGEWFQDHKLEFLVKYEEVTTQIEVESIIETLRMASEGEVWFGTYEKFRDICIRVQNQILVDQTEEYINEKWFDNLVEGHSES